jgi:hypothetical protein
MGVIEGFAGDSRDVLVAIENDGGARSQTLDKGIVQLS